MPETPSGGAWVLLAPRAALSTLRPLILAHARRREVRVHELEATVPAEALAPLLDGAAGALLVGGRLRAPRTALPGPFLTASDGRAVPVGWLPYQGAGALEPFARAASRVQRRRGGLGPLALLGQWDERFLRLADRMEANLQGAACAVVRWTAERIHRDDLLVALRCGPGFGIYFGHGRPDGWAAYHGLRSRHLQAGGEPLGALLSVSCYTASRWRVGYSFAETAALRGMAAGVLGAVMPVRHVENVRWMVGLAAALRRDERTLGGALLAAAPPEAEAQARFRILGDPLALLVGAPAAERRARRMYAPGI